MFSLLFLINLARDLSILMIFPKNQLWLHWFISSWIEEDVFTSPFSLADWCFSLSDFLFIYWSIYQWFSLGFKFPQIENLPVFFITVSTSPRICQISQEIFIHLMLSDELNIWVWVLKRKTLLWWFKMSPILLEKVFGIIYSLVRRMAYEQTQQIGMGEISVDI